MRFVHISDTHCNLYKLPLLPDGDVLIHSGDLCNNGTLWEFEREIEYLSKYSHKTKIFVPGNHDIAAEEDPILIKQICKDKGIICLIHESLELYGLKFFGSPYTPEFYNWAFNRERFAPLRRLWAQIPDDTEFLITHGPPHMTLDQVFRVDGSAYHSPRHEGCEELTARIKQLSKLRVHCFGHIHESAGFSSENGIQYYNSALCDQMYYLDLDRIKVFDL